MLVFDLPISDKIREHVQPHVFQHLIEIIQMQLHRMPSAPMLDLHDDRQCLHATEHLYVCQCDPLRLVYAIR